MNMIRGVTNAKDINWNRSATCLNRTDSKSKIMISHNLDFLVSQRNLFRIGVACFVFLLQYSSHGFAT